MAFIYTQTSLIWPRKRYNYLLLSHSRWQLCLVSCNHPTRVGQTLLARPRRALVNSVPVQKAAQPHILTSTQPTYVLSLINSFHPQLPAQPWQARCACKCRRVTPPSQWHH